MSAAIRLARPRRRRGVSLTPLIDVVFILLIFFMLASSFVRERSIGLDTERDGAAQASDTASFLLRVGPEWVELGGERLDAVALTAALEALGASDEQARVSVQPTPGTPVQRVVMVLDALDAARIDAVSLTGGRGR